MTLETALLSALSAVTGALVWAVSRLYERLQKAEETVESLRLEMENLERENGEKTAQVEMFNRCPKRAECPFAFQHPSISRPSHGHLPSP